MNSYSREGSICFKLEETNELPSEPYYVFICTEETLKEFERKMKVNSVFELKGKTVIAFIKNMHIFKISYDDGTEDAMVKAATPMTITAIDDTDDEFVIVVKAKNSEKTVSYTFEKGSYLMKAFVLEMDVIEVKDLIGRSVIAYMDDGKVIYLTRDFWD